MHRQLTVSHLAPDIADEASGISAMLRPLCEQLAARNNSVSLHCLGMSRPIAGVQAQVFPPWQRMQRFPVSPRLAAHLPAVFRKQHSIVHNHGLWSMVSMCAALFESQGKAKLITSPHGTLAPWAFHFHHGRKRLAWPIQKRVLTRAALLHATSEEEYQHIRQLGISTPVAVIPNGVDIPEKAENAGLKGLKRPSKTMLYLSRIHPIKGIDLLLRAWSAIEAQHTEWRLVIAGVGDPQHELEVKQQAKDLRLHRVDFPGPFFGHAKTKAYFDADVFILPSHSENFGMVVAEALAHGVPTIVTKGAPWSGLERERCGWWIDRNLDAMVATMDTAMNMDDVSRLAMGARGRAWMSRCFSWQQVAEQMENAYRWVLDGTALPSEIRLS